MEGVSPKGSFRIYEMGGGRHHTEIRINPRESPFLRILFIWLYHSATKNSKKMEFRIFFAPPNDAKILLRDALEIFDPKYKKIKMPKIP